MKTRIDVSVGKLEEEREGEIQELKRGKVEALRLMQVRGRPELSTLSKAYTEYSFCVTPPSQKSNFCVTLPSQKSNIFCDPSLPKEYSFLGLPSLPKEYFEIVDF